MIINVSIKEIGVLELASVLVLRTCEYLVFGQSPLHTYRRVVIADTCLCLRSIDIVNLIRKDGLVGEDGKAVSEAARDEQLTFILVAKLYRNILTKSATAFSKVNSNI